MIRVRTKTDPAQKTGLLPNGLKRKVFRYDKPVSLLQAGFLKN
jgi:hypothetical protein